MARYPLDNADKLQETHWEKHPAGCANLQWSCKWCLRSTGVCAEREGQQQKGFKCAYGVSKFSTLWGWSLSRQDDDSHNNPRDHKSSGVRLILCAALNCFLKLHDPRISDKPGVLLISHGGPDNIQNFQRRYFSFISGPADQEKRAYFCDNPVRHTTAMRSTICCLQPYLMNDDVNKTTWPSGHRLFCPIFSIHHGQVSTAMHQRSLASYVTAASGPPIWVTARCKHQMDWKGALCVQIKLFTCPTSIICFSFWRDTST